MLEQLLGGFINKEQAAYDAIKDTLEDVAQKSGRIGKIECDCGKHFEDCTCVLERQEAWGHNDFIIALKPTDDKFNFRCFIMKATPEFVASVPATIVREITIKEIIGDSEQDE